MIIIFILLILAAILLFWGGFFDVVWLPTKKRDYDRIAKLIDLQPNEVLYDLGSGTGALLFYLSKKYNIRCVGIEISPILYLYSKVKSLFYKKVDIKYGNLFNHDLSKADGVYVFLHPKAYGKLRKKFLADLKKESKIVVSCWPFNNIEPVRMSKEEGGYTYYLYKKELLC